MNLFSEAYYSMDNTMEKMVFEMIRSFMKKRGNAQLESLNNMFEKSVSKEDQRSLKCQIKVYRKIQKHIGKIEKLTEKRSYDSISQPELIKHINKLWTLRHIMWT